MERKVQIGVVALALLGLAVSEIVGASMFIASFVAGLAVQVGFRDVGKHSVTIDGKTYPVAKGAHILIDSKPGNLKEIPGGARVAHVRLCVDQKTVGTLFVSAK